MKKTSANELSMDGVGGVFVVLIAGKGPQVSRTFTNMGDKKSCLNYLSFIPSNYLKLLALSFTFILNQL